MSADARQLRAGRGRRRIRLAAQPVAAIALQAREHLPAPPGVAGRQPEHPAARHAPGFVELFDRGVNGLARAVELGHVRDMSGVARRRRLAERGREAEDGRAEGGFADHQRHQCRGRPPHRPDEGQSRQPHDPREHAARPHAREARQQRVTIDRAERDERDDEDQLGEQDAAVRRVPQRRHVGELHPGVVGARHDHRRERPRGETREPRADARHHAVARHHARAEDHDRERDEAADPERGGQHMTPVQQHARREVAPVGGMSAQRRRERDGTGQSQGDDARAISAAADRDDQRGERDDAAEPDDAEVRPRKDEWHDPDGLRPTSAAHGARAQDDLGGARQQQAADADEAPDAESATRRDGVRLIDGQHEDLEREPADETGERGEREPPDEDRDDDGHLIRNGKSPSVRWPSRATTLQ